MVEVPVQSPLLPLGEGSFIYMCSVLVPARTQHAVAGRVRLGGELLLACLVRVSGSSRIL
jgi:hypothetical protein